MRKIYVILAAVTGMTLVSCTNQEYLGEVGTTAQETEQGTAITFGGYAGKMTRATSNTGTVAEMLDGHFKIYGVKQVNSTWKGVFENYAVWNSTTTTATNPDGAEADADAKSAMNGWEYVGDGSSKGGLAKQTAKYWDYSASNYHFVAGTPATAFTFKIEDTSDATNKGDIKSATVTGITGHINANPTGAAISTNPVYIADPVNVPKSDYKKEVTFNFTRQQTFVRVGVFETIPGYSIKSIEFYTQGTSGWVAPTGDNKNNIILTSTTPDYFSGATNATVTINYNWSGTTPSYTYAYSGLTTAKNWYGGLLTGVKATSSTENTVANLYGTDKDMATNGYFTVIPTASGVVAQPILIKCNYTLLAEDGKGEEITVTGATAAIPAAFTFWKPNTSYTYLFKISINTNGSTGNPEGTDPDPAGLYPITFDAVVTAEADGMNEGIITMVSTPCITTYQESSVTTAGIEYKKGSKIYFTAQNNETGNLSPLKSTAQQGFVRVWKLDSEKTEADLQLVAPTGTPETVSILDADLTINTTNGGWKLEKDKAAYFTPDASTGAGWYAIQYQITEGAVAYAYKVFEVK